MQVFAIVMMLCGGGGILGSILLGSHDGGPIVLFLLSLVISLLLLITGGCLGSCSDERDSAKKWHEIARGHRDHLHEELGRTRARLIAAKTKLAKIDNLSMEAHARLTAAERKLAKIHNMTGVGLKWPPQNAFLPG